MFALRANDVHFVNDVAYGNDVLPLAKLANITSLRPTGATSLELGE